MLEPSNFKSICSPYVENKNIWVAYSGGIDSHVLLHLAHSTYQAIKAVHINHGLSPNADYWQQHCQQVCDQLNIPLTVIKVTIDKTAKQSLEDAARKARRSAWQQLLTEQDLLLVAHHAQDQAETILYRLFRGAGPQGLAGMQQHTRLGRAQLYRPLLNTAKQDILTYSGQHALKWITDESNTNQEFDRNFIRASVLPQLDQRWPAVVSNINRAGQLSRQLLDCLQPQIAEKLQVMLIGPDNALDLQLLQQQEQGWQIELLRAWLQQHKLQASYQQLIRIQQEVIGARIDAQPSLKIQAKLVRRYKQQLHVVNMRAATPTTKYVLAWNIQNKLTLPNGMEIDAAQVFKTADTALQFNSANVEVSSNAAGKKAKKIFQKFAVPVWQRANYPAIYADGKLIAIVGLWNV